MCVRTLAVTLASLILWCSLAGAGDQALLRVERAPGVDRDVLIAAGVTLVAEMNNCFLAVGEPGDVSTIADHLGVASAVIDPRVEGFEYAILAVIADRGEADVAACGKAIWSEDTWTIVRAPVIDPEQCMSPHWFWNPLTLEPMAASKPPPAAFAGFADGTEQIVVKPMVQDMVDAVDQALVMARWHDVVDVASTRYSTSAGCQTAAQMVYSFFDSLGLNPVYQNHTSGHAPNVIGTLTGITNPDDVYIVIGHLDDMPSSGDAPGADDNASGAANVMVLAEVMASYGFASTVKFLAVTGEEFGLYGSEYYASQAAANGENILAVLNADMTAWEGEPPPVSVEDLDFMYDSNSTWLMNLFQDAASAYGTGCIINDLLCPNMRYSDHWPFWQEGWSGFLGMTDDHGLCGSGGTYPYYHTSQDTIANCGDPLFYIATVKAYAAAAGHLADPLFCVRAPTPENLTAQAGGANQVSLTWTSSGSGLVFDVYRAPGGCAGWLDYVKVGETTSTSFLDSSASGGVTYAYAVTAREALGACVSRLSDCVEATTSGGCLEAPGFAGVTSVTDPHAQTCTLSVAWSPAQPYCGATAVYNVYRSTTEEFVPDASNRVAMGVTGTTYIDAFDLVSGDTYYYIVRAVDPVNGAEDVNTVELSGVPTGPLTVGTWTDDAGDTGAAKLVLDAPWSVTPTGGNTGAAAYQTGTYGANLCAGAVTPPLLLSPGAQLTFWSRYDIENDWDKGEVQVSTDGGATWPQTGRVPVNYPGYASRTSDACGLPSGNYFSGTDNTYGQYTGSLDAWAGQEVLIRWVLSSDSYTNGTGWRIDDISITNVAVPSTCTTQAEQPLFADGFENGDTAGWTMTVSGS